MKQIKVRRYSYRKHGKTVRVPRHIRRVKFNTTHIAPEDRVFSNELEEINIAKRDLGLMNGRFGRKEKEQIEDLIEKQIRESRRRKAGLYSDREHESEKLRRRNILYNQIILPDLDIRKVQRSKRKAKFNSRIKSGIGAFYKDYPASESDDWPNLPKRSAKAREMSIGYEYWPTNKAGGEFGTVRVKGETYNPGSRDVLSELGIRKVGRRK